MRSTLCNSIFGDDDDLIRTFDRGKTMSDGDRCAVFGKFFQAFLDLPFTLIIQCTGSFIQDQDRRVSYCCGSSMIKSWMFARFAAAMISSSEASGFP